MTYKACYSMFKENPNISFISYEKLCNDEKYWLNILKIVGIDEPHNFIFRESVKRNSQCAQRRALPRNIKNIR